MFIPYLVPAISKEDCLLLESKLGRKGREKDGCRGSEWLLLGSKANWEWDGACNRHPGCLSCGISPLTSFFLLGPTLLEKSANWGLEREKGEREQCDVDMI